MTTDVSVSDSHESGGVFLEDIVDVLGGVVWEFDWSTGAFTYVSAGAERLLGYPAADWLRPGFWQEHLHPDDAEQAASFCVASTRARKNHEFEYRMIHRSGAEVWIWDIVTVDAQRGMGGPMRGILIDVTEQHREQERYRRQSEEFDAVFRVMQDLYFRIDGENRVVDFKAPARDLLYRSPEEIRGANLVGLLPSSLHEMLETNLALARETDTMVITGYELYTAGQLRYWEARFLPLGGDDVVVISRDVSDRHEANARLAQSQERYRSLVEMSPYAIYVVGADERVIFANAAAESMFECSGDAVFEGTPISALIPEGREESPGMRELQEVALATANCPEGADLPRAAVRRCSARTLSGRTIDIERTAAGIRFRGGPAVMVLARDITDELKVESALRANEALLREAQRMADMGYYTYFISEDTWESSEGLDRVFGIPSDHPKTSEGWTRLIHPDDREATVAYMVEEVVGAQQPFDRDYRIVRPSDGEVRWVHGSGQLVLDDDGAPLRLFGYIQDITERKLAQEAERRSFERLSAMAAELTVTEDRERRRLAEELHDRVSQQLAVAMMHLRSASGGDEVCRTPDLVKAVALVDGAIAETRAITTQLAPPILYELGLGPALRWQCEDVMNTLGLKVAFSGTEIDESGVDDEAKMVLFRAVRELLVNVVKHAHTDSAWVSLDTLPGWLQVTVVDEGRGFDSTAVSAGSGESGFGLFSIRERLPHLGGEFEFESTPGRGTRVTLRIPRTGG